MAAVIDIRNSRVIGTVEQYKELLVALGAADIVIDNADLVLVDQPVPSEMVQQALTPRSAV